MISPGILSDSARYLRDSGSYENFESYFRNFKSLLTLNNPKVVGGFLKRLKLEKNIFSKVNTLLEVKKIVIERYIKAYEETVCRRVSWGIEKAVFDHLQEENPNLYSCLVDAGLVSTDYGVVSWWFENILDVASTKKHKTGLRGEYLSKEYEIKRGVLKKNIRHIALEKSDAGYDLISRLNPGCDTPLYIEVKTTKNYSRPSFFVTKNEWEKACMIEDYLFHLWVVGGKNVATLYHLKKEFVGESIPKNRGQGSWRDVEITVNLAQHKAVYATEYGL